MHQVQFRYRDITKKEYIVGSNINRETTWKFQLGEIFFFFGTANKVVGIDLVGMTRLGGEEFDMVQIVYVEPATGGNPYDVYRLSEINE